MFAELYKDVGITQAYVGIGYWVEDVRDSDYFNLDEMERAKEAFSDEIAYIDSNAYTTADAEYKRTSISFDFQGIDSNYKEVQPVNMVYGRYLNDGGCAWKKEKCGYGYGQRHAFCLVRKMQWERPSGPPFTAIRMNTPW